MEDRFNESMSFIVHFVILEALLERLQMLLTFSRHQVMYDISCVLSCAEVTCKGTLSYGNKVNDKIKH